MQKSWILSWMEVLINMAHNCFEKAILKQYFKKKRKKRNKAPSLKLRKALPAAAL